MLAQSIVKEGMKFVAAGMNPMDLKRGIDKAVEAVMAESKKLSKPTTTSKEIEQVASISANSDTTTIGEKVAQAMEKVGKEGVITVEDGKSLEMELEIVEGMQFDRCAPHLFDLVILARFFEWRDALLVVGPKTMIRWQRAGWRLFWRWKCRPGRPRIPVELRTLIRRMARENPVWGEERIASELLVKLGIQVSPRTVRKYMPRRHPGQPRGDQRWATFLKSHARVIVACDFFVAVTATF